MVLAVLEPNCAGRIPLLLVLTDTNHEAIAFVDECDLLRKHVAYGSAPKAHELSDETAARFAAWAKAR